MKFVTECPLTNATSGAALSANHIKKNDQKFCGGHRRQKQM
jgi:hypothetical protein